MALCNVLALVLRTCLAQLSVDEVYAMVQPPCHHRVYVPLVLRASRHAFAASAKKTIPLFAWLSCASRSMLFQVHSHLFSTTQVVLMVRVGARSEAMCLFYIVASELNGF